MPTGIYKRTEKNYKQFCPQGHDTKTVGRTNNYKCKICEEIAIRKNILNRIKFSYEDYLALFVKQDNKCLGCGTPQNKLKSKLHLDHCHETGRVRGLLCKKCNFVLGLVKDDVRILKGLTDYLNNQEAVKHGYCC